MNDEQNPAETVGDDVVQPEAEQVEAPEAADSTEGQVETPAADDSEEAAPSDEAQNVSKSKARRERQKAYVQSLEKKSADLEAQLSRFEQSGKDPAPVETDFEDYSEYLIAKALHKRDQASRSGQTAALDAERDQIQQLQEASKAAIWGEQVQEAVTRYEDYEAVAMNPRLPVTKQMATLIQESDKGADVLYYLGSHPEEATVLAGLPPHRQAMAIGRIEATLAAPQPKTKTNAPPPIKPVKGAAPATKSPDDMTPAEYRAWRMAGGTY